MGKWENIKKIMLAGPFSLGVRNDHVHSLGEWRGLNIIFVDWILGKDQVSKWKPIWKSN